MEKFFGQIIAAISASPHMVYVSLGVAVLFVIGGIVLYKKRAHIKGWRWPGVTCALLGCASLATNILQRIA